MRPHGRPAPTAGSGGKESPAAGDQCDVVRASDKCATLRPYAPHGGLRLFSLAPLRVPSLWSSSSLLTKGPLYDTRRARTAPTPGGRPRRAAGAR